MLKRILIPIDFNVESLITLKKALDSLTENQVEATLLYAEYLPESITQLLFYSPKEKREQLIPPVFNEALTIIKNRYEKNLNSLTIEFFHGYGVNAFKNLINGHRIDLIFIPNHYKLKPLKNGFDPIPIILKSKLPIQQVSWISEHNFTGLQSLSSLFV